MLVDTYNGVAVSRSNITGRSILSGRAKSTSEAAIMANRTVVESQENISQEGDNSQDKKIKHNESTSPTQSETADLYAPPMVSERCKIISTKEESIIASEQNDVLSLQQIQVASEQNDVLSLQQIQVSTIWPEPKDTLLKEISTDSINIHPIKRCTKCSNCRDCKKNYLPDQPRQKEQAEIVKRPLTFENGKYTAAYPYNGLLSQLATNEVPCMRMMKSLETKLKKVGFIKAFNENVADFMNRGVIK